MSPRASEAIDILTSLRIIDKISQCFGALYILPLFLCFSLLPSSGHLLQRKSASEPLENGRILDQGSSFTYQDVLGGLVGYMPGGLHVAVDEFRFSLTDGLHMDTGRMEIYIDLPTGDTPYLAINRGLQLSAGTKGMEENGCGSLSVCITSFHVSAVGGYRTKCSELRETGVGENCYFMSHKCESLKFFGQDAYVCEFVKRLRRVYTISRVLKSLNLPKHSWSPVS